jgi:glyoxylase I family protein
MLHAIHHVAIIAADYERSKRFYTEFLGLEIVREVYRAGRDSWKLDLAVNGQYQIELFSFPNPPKRPSRPEACGLRHLAFSVKNLEEVVEELAAKGIETEPTRVDEWTGRRFTFLTDPDGLPVELYEWNHDSEDSEG